MKQIQFLKRILVGIVLMCLSSLLTIGLVFPNYLEDNHDYQIVYQRVSGQTITFFARGERNGLLGQHEVITISPENIASRNWAYNPKRDLRYNGEGFVLYKIENGILHVYSHQILSDIDYSYWILPIMQESFETKKIFINQKNSQEKGYCVLSVRGDND